jgi:hypothetical protein
MTKNLINAEIAKKRINVKIHKLQFFYKIEKQNKKGNICVLSQNKNVAFDVLICPYL